MLFPVYSVSNGIDWFPLQFLRGIERTLQTSLHSPGRGRLVPLFSFLTQQGVMTRRPSAASSQVFEINRLFAAKRQAKGRAWNVPSGVRLQREQIINKTATGGAAVLCLRLLCLRLLWLGPSDRWMVRGIKTNYSCFLFRARVSR
jgi:hypothetical protein